MNRRVLSPEALFYPERRPWYRARVERDRLARHGTLGEWRAAEARVRELAPREVTP